MNGQAHTRVVPVHRFEIGCTLLSTTCLPNVVERNGFGVAERVAVAFRIERAVLVGGHQLGVAVVAACVPIVLGRVIVATLPKPPWLAHAPSLVMLEDGVGNGVMYTRPMPGADLATHFGAKVFAVHALCSVNADAVSGLVTCSAVVARRRVALDGARLRCANIRANHTLSELGVVVGLAFATVGFGEVGGTCTPLAVWSTRPMIAAVAECVTRAVGIKVIIAVTTIITRKVFVAHALGRAVHIFALAVHTARAWDTLALDVGVVVLADVAIREVARLTLASVGRAVALAVARDKRIARAVVARLPACVALARPVAQTRAVAVAGPDIAFAHDFAVYTLEHVAATTYAVCTHALVVARGVTAREAAIVAVVSLFALAFSVFACFVGPARRVARDVARWPTEVFVA